MKTLNVTEEGGHQVVVKYGELLPGALRAKWGENDERHNLQSKTTAKYY